MFDRLRTRLLAGLRVPPEPHPPLGAPGSVRVFRAGRNLYKLRLLRWGFGQMGALAGIVASLIFLNRLERTFNDPRDVRPPAAVAPASAFPAAPPVVLPAAAPIAAPPEKPTSSAQRRARNTPARIVQRWPWWIFPLLTFFEWVGVAIFLAQIPLTYALVRLDFELRWYIVTDRSLRIRTGIATVQESTMSFANVQQVVVTQGPLQRYLGMADVRVQSAGGGGDHHDSKAGDSLHTGVFHGVDNAPEIRDLVLARLRQFRESGLGDPDEPAVASAATVVPANPAVPPAASSALAAARELLHEARALRAALS